MKKLFLSIIILVVFICTAKAQSNQYKALVKEYLTETGSLDNFQSTIDNMLDLFKDNEAFREVPKEYWKDIVKEFSNISVDDIVDLYVPIYYKYYTESDLRELIAFYQTPIGLKMKKNNSKVTEESMKAGEAWGRKIGMQVATRLQEKMGK
jgi:hypothetical protein